MMAKTASKATLTAVLAAFAAFVLAAVPSSAPASGAAPAGRGIKIISYNVMDGMQDYNIPVVERRNTNGVRRAAVAAWLKAQDPDVVQLDELCGFDERMLKDFAKSYGHDYSALSKTNGYSVGLTSRRPIEVRLRRQEGFCHGMMWARTYGIDFIATHFAPFDWRQRRREAEAIAGIVQALPLERCIVLGDLNAFSPSDADWLDHRERRRALEAEEDAERKASGVANLVNGQFDYSVISTLLAAGLTDAVRPFVPANRRATWPTHLIDRPGKPDRDASVLGARLDFILVTPDLAKDVTDGWLFNTDPIMDRLSDHYPVGIVVRGK